MPTLLHVKVPDIGDFKDILVIEMLVRPGDLVKLEQPVVTLESDKATLDVPTPSAGRVASIAVAPGSRVSEGSLLLTLELESEEPREAEPPAVTEEPRAIAQEPRAVAEEPRAVAPPGAERASRLVPPPSEAAQSPRIYAAPSIRRLARQLGADLTEMTGSGRGGRILVQDVHDSVRKELQAITAKPGEPPPARTIDHAKYGRIERKPLSRIRRISGPALAHNWATIPHVTNFDQADITELEAFRGALNQESGSNPKLTLLSFLVKGIASVLQRAPEFNASLEGDDLLIKHYINIGVAVDSPDGLVVPVLRDVDKLGILEIARQLTDKAASARTGKLKPSDLEGGTFTISSLGPLGGTGFTPIINASQIAILGVSRAAIQPRYEGSQFLPRLMLPLSLSWDHRATDGVAAAKLLGGLAALLQDFRRASL